MKSRATFLIIATAVSLLCLPLAAQQTAVSLKHRGADGHWFPQAMVDKMQLDILDLDRLREKQPQLKLKLDIRLKRIGELNLAVVLANKAIDVNKKAIAIAEGAIEKAAKRTVAAEERTLEVERKMNVWYRHPVTLVSAGAVAVVIIEVVLYAVLK